jgi:Domain of unknown function (DUF4190)
MSQSSPMTRPAPAQQAPAGPQRTNKMAIWSLVLSILTLGGLGSLAGIWLGAVARGRTDTTGERGRGLATAGIVVGVVTLLIAIAYWVYIGMHTGGGTGGGSGGGGGY